MPEVLRVALKSDYREPLRAIGFVGRDAEVSRLSSILSSRKSGTILVSGHRGVGKTALVEEAISKAREATSTMVVARLTLPHMCPDVEPRDEALRHHMLQSLARSLYFSVKREPPGQQLELLLERCRRLYDKTYLTSLTSEKVDESLVGIEARRTERTVSRTRVEVGPVLAKILAMTLVAGTTLGAAALSAVLARWTSLGPWSWAVAALLAAGILLASTTFDYSEEIEDTLGGELTQKDKATETGVFDLSAETLEFELRDLVSDFADSGYRCVFVIDELDKLELFASDCEKRLEEQLIFRMVASLKNFFTLG